MPPWPSTARDGRPSTACTSASPRCRARSAVWASRSKKVLHASERDEDERAAWWAATTHFDPRRFVFVDESGTNLAMTPRYGRAPRGQRVSGNMPRNPGPNVPLPSARTTTGITAAMTMTGATDHLVWALFVRQILVPTLHPGQIVLCESLAVHKNQDIRQLIEAAG